MGTNWNTVYQTNPYREKLPHDGVVEFLGFLRNKNVNRILDLGCGDGRHLIFLAKQGFKPVGIDNALWGIQKTKEWMKKEDLLAEAVCADVCFLPWNDESFDSVISIQVIHHQRLNAIQETLSGVKRILRTGGFFYFTVPEYPPGNNWKGNKFIEVEEHTYVPLEGFEKDLPHHMFTREELVSTLNDFEILEVKKDPTKYLGALVCKTK
jgi:SAM-dependent methyltransferase